MSPNGNPSPTERASHVSANLARGQLRPVFGPDRPKCLCFESGRAIFPLYRPSQGPTKKRSGRNCGGGAAALRRSIERWLPGNQLGLPENAFLQNETPLGQTLQRLQGR